MPLLSLLVCCSKKRGYREREEKEKETERENSHNTNQKNQTNPQLLPPGGMQPPNHSLRQNQRQRIQGEICRSGHNRFFGHAPTARTWEEGIVVPVKGGAVHEVHDEEDDGQRGDGAAGEEAGPGEEAALAFRGEDAGPVAEDGDFDEGDEPEVEAGCYVADLGVCC